VRHWWALLAVAVAATLLILAPTRTPHGGARWYDDDIYDEIASGPAD